MDPLGWDPGPLQFQGQRKSNGDAMPWPLSKLPPETSPASSKSIASQPASTRLFQLARNCRGGYTTERFQEISYPAPILCYLGPK